MMTNWSGTGLRSVMSLPRWPGANTPPATAILQATTDLTRAELPGTAVLADTPSLTGLPLPTSRPAPHHDHTGPKPLTARPWPSGEWLRGIRPRSLRKNPLADHGDHC